MASMKRELKKEVIRLRTQMGMSYSEIAKVVDGKVSKSTMSYWLKDHPLTKEQRERVYGKRSDSRLSGAANAIRWESVRSDLLKRARCEFGKIKLDYNSLALAGAALYWGEGTKSRDAVIVSNTDPELLQFFVTWLRNVVGVDDIDFRCDVSVHLNNGITLDEVKMFWSNKLGINLSQFGYSRINPTSPGWRHSKKARHKYGVLRVYLGSVCKI